MSQRVHRLSTTTRGRIYALLVALMLFALLHVSLHGLQNIGNDLDGSDCQICRLGHTPMDIGATVVLSAPKFIHYALVELSNTQSPYSPRYVPWLARGPPQT